MISELGACMHKLVHLYYGTLKSEHDYVPPEAKCSQIADLLLSGAIRCLLHADLAADIANESVRPS